MSVPIGETNQVYVFCDKCKQNVSVDIQPEQIRAQPTGITGILSVHGSPQHAILVYLDKQLKVRGCEYPSSVQVKTTAAFSATSEALATQLGKDDRATLDLLVDAFGKTRKVGIDALGDIMAQVIIKNHVYLVHDDPGIGRVVLENLQRLFAQQETSLQLITHRETTGIPANALVFDLQLVKFLTEGVKMDNRFFRGLIKDCLDESNSYYRLRNEVSKILFAYSVVKKKLLWPGEKLLDTQLARESSIDFSLMPVLLRMAEGEGINVKMRVEYDGLGRAIRSL
jgi:hypothetical protein